MLSRRPTERPKRLVLPLVLTTDTPLTSTLNISSTAALISGLVASCSTLKVTALVLSATCVAFSERIGVTRLDDEHVGQVARGEIQVLVDFVGDHQHRVKVHGLELGGQLFGLGRIQLDGIDHGHAALTGE